MQKFKALLLALVLLLCLFPAARGESMYPLPQGQSADGAGVLSRETKEDLSALSALLQKEKAGSLYVATRHFLGGKEPAAYAQGLFESWALTEKDALLLMVIGEERYALCLGEEAKKNLPVESRTLLLGAFRTAFLNREYDRAVGDLALNLAAFLAPGKALSLNGLFGRESLTPSNPKEQIQKTVNGLWKDMFGEIQEEAEEWKEKQEQEETESNWKTILIWGLVIYFLFFRKKKRKKKRRR